MTLSQSELLHRLRSDRGLVLTGLDGWTPESFGEFLAASGGSQHPTLRAIGRRHPGIGWLAALPREDRRWYGCDDMRREMLLDRYPSLSLTEWVRLFR